MTTLNEDLIFRAASDIILEVDHRVTFSFTERSVEIRFPTTRRLAEYLEVQHYYILPYFAMLEEQNLINRVERTGISTTGEGTRKLVQLMIEEHREKLMEILGLELLDQIQRKVGIW